MFTKRLKLAAERPFNIVMNNQANKVTLYKSHPDAGWVWMSLCFFWIRQWLPLGQRSRYTTNVKI